MPQGASGHIDGSFVIRGSATREPVALADTGTNTNCHTVAINIKALGGSDCMAAEEGDSPTFNPSIETNHLFFSQVYERTVHQATLSMAMIGVRSNRIV